MDVGLEHGWLFLWERNGNALDVVSRQIIYKYQKRDLTCAAVLYCMFNLPFHQLIPAFIVAPTTMLLPAVSALSFCCLLLLPSTVAICCRPLLLLPTVAAVCYDYRRPLLSTVAAIYCHYCLLLPPSTATVAAVRCCHRRFMLYHFS